MTKDHQSRHDRRRERGAAHPSPDTVIMVAGIVTTTPPQLLNPMPSDTLRIGVPIMRPASSQLQDCCPRQEGVVRESGSRRNCFQRLFRRRLLDRHRA